MKTLITLCFCLCFFLISCQKEEISPNKTVLTPLDNSITKKHRNNNKLPNYYTYNCSKINTDTGNTTKGTRCAVSTGTGCALLYPCNADSPLGPHINDLIESFFSLPEIENWGNEDPNLILSAQYINDHYGFYMELYNLGLAFHPDTIIARNGW